LNEDLTVNQIDDQHIQIPIDTKLNITTNSLELTNIETHFPQQIQTESINLTSPITLQQQQEEKESEQVEDSSYKKIIPTNVEHPRLNSPIPKPPRQNLYKEKKSSTIDGLIRIINDHTKRANIPQTNENVSYFRVAKSRCGKFETDNQGFVNNSIAIFDSTNQPKTNQQTNKNSSSSSSSQILTNSTQQKSVSNNIQQQTKGKQAYNLLKKYEKEEQLQSTNNTDYLKSTNDKDKSPTPPIQVEFSNKN